MIAVARYVSLSFHYTANMLRLCRYLELLENKRVTNRHGVSTSRLALVGTTLQASFSKAFPWIKIIVFYPFNSINSDNGRMSDRPLSDPINACSLTHIYTNIYASLGLYYEFTPLQWRHNGCSLTVVCSTVYSSSDQKKHQNSTSLAFMRGIHRSPVNSPHKWSVTRKMFPFDCIIMLLRMKTLISVEEYVENSLCWRLLLYDWCQDSGQL